MVPEDCVHLRLNGLAAISRQLDIDCVPAVVGWEFHKGGNHPILDGCIVLKKHEKVLREAWKEFYEKKQTAAEKRRKERALRNWRRLVKGMLTMKKVRAKFLVADRRSMQIDEKLETRESETSATDDTVLSWPRTIFNLPHTSVNISKLSSDLCTCYIYNFLRVVRDMVGWQLRLTPKQAAAKIVVAVVGLAIGAYGVATVYEPLQGLQDELDLRKGELLRYYKTKHDERIRQAFYKRHDMAPNFSKVFDLRSSLSAHGIICSKFEPVVAPSDIMLEKLGLRPVSEWTASTITHRPGMVMLNGIFKSISHLQWIKRSLFIYAESPGFTNVGLQVPNVRNVFKEYGRQLRWSTLGLHYDWATKIYPLEGESLPEELVSLSNVLSQALGIGPMYADAAIINFYSRKSTLAPHVDR
ncbi:unnamed protein product [Wuchereria bancrofti]|uniref:Rad4 beta-hairpin domain-containing protein n=1 Tax=Wuchereria bancrofti TaxID=6293 RepID=A0A3P7FX66_WUCBA|nr:unnamed protein product [Wuchereria bancrofti]